MEHVTISKDDIRALQMADRVHYHTHAGRSYVVAELDGGYSDRPRVFSRKEQELFPIVDKFGGRDRSREIDADHGHTTLSDYSGRTGDFSGYAGPYAHGTEMIRTVARQLREGDSLVFSWVASNNNENVKALGWVRDEFQLRTGRFPQEGERTRPANWYLIEVYVGPDNTARLVKRTD